MRLSFALISSFEKLIETGYEWIYYFDESKKLADQKLLNDDFIPSLSSIETPDSLAEIAPILELLLRDDAFFSATSNLITSLENHGFCIICAFQPEHERKHENHEPNIWEIANLIPKMEVAIVQAAQACEGLLGKPGKRDSRALTRWKSKVNLNPHDNFLLSDQNYFDYYYHLFNIRGNAAHNLGSFPHEVSREMTIQSQGFAWKVIHSYYQRHRLPHVDALIKLNFNQNLLSPVFMERFK